MRRTPSLALALALALALPIAFAASPGLAQGGPSALATAERAYLDVDFEGTRTSARAAIAEGELDTRDLARAYELLAVASAALGDDETARDAYVRLLVLAPDAGPGDILPPERRTAYREARAIVALQVDPLSVEVRWDATARAARITVRDALGLASGIRFERFASGASASRTVVPLAEGVATVPLADAEGELAYAVTVLDAHGNHWLERGTAEAPVRLRIPSAVEAAPPVTEERRLSRRTRSLLWIGSAVTFVAAGALTAGLVVHSHRTTPLATDVVVTPLSAP